MKKVSLFLVFFTILPCALCLAADPDIRLPQADGSPGTNGHITWPSPRFSDNGNGTVSDNLTGLMWMKEANCVDTYDITVGANTRLDGKLTWAEAHTFAQMVNSGAISCSVTTTYTNWRVPNRREIWSLTDFSQRTDPPYGDSALPAGHPFINHESIYWTSTSYRQDPASAWVYYLDDPRLDYQNKGIYYFVWLCRGGN